MEQRLACRPDELRARALAALGGLEQALVALVGGDSALDACHLVRLLEVGQHAPDLRSVHGVERGLAGHAPGAPRRLDLEVVALPGAHTHDLAAAGDAEALL